MKRNEQDSILKEQIEYYEARATEYDEWFLRRGRYDHGSKLKKLWFSEVEQVKAELKKFNPKGKVLEIACGTCWWTEQLVKYAEHITAVDAASEVLILNKKKNGQEKVNYIKADLFNWNPQDKYDVIFFSFWLSHVPPDKFEQFWLLVQKALRPQGRVFFIDSLKSEGPEKTYTINNPFNPTSLRKLNDGRTFTVIKVFYRPEKLTQDLKQLGWYFKVKNTTNYFLYGFGSLRKQNRL